MSRLLTLTALVFAGLSGAAHADVYRWVDDHGEAHYTDRWVPGSELIKSSKPRPSAESPAPAPVDTQAKGPVPSAADAAKQAKANEAAVKQDVAKTKEAQCKQAKDRYQKAIESRRIYKADGKDGEERVYMTDEESDKYRVDARNDVILACGSPPPAAQPE